LFSNPSPCPPSLSKGRGSVGKRGVKPLSINLFPLSFEGEGINGVRLVNTLCIVDILFKKPF